MVVIKIYFYTLDDLNCIDYTEKKYAYATIKNRSHTCLSDADLTNKISVNKFFKILTLHSPKNDIFTYTFNRMWKTKL